MPAVRYPQLYLCVDGGGTSVKVAISSKSNNGAVLARAMGGPCNVKTVGHEVAISTILETTRVALASVDLSSKGDVYDLAGALGRRQIFNKVWLGLAGIGHQSDVDAFAPLVCKALNIAEGDEDALRITNDGHLLASPCATLPNIDSTIALVAGTGTVGLGFTKRGKEIDLVAVSGGWGYLLGDEGSAFGIARHAIRFILDDDDARKSMLLARPGTVLPLTLPLITALLEYFGVGDAGELVVKTYSDHSSSTSSSFTVAETNRKVWIAEAARIVFDYAFGGNSDEPSRLAALALVKEGVQPLVQLAIRLIGDRSIIVPDRASLSLGGGLWNAPGYIELLHSGLKAAGVVFAETIRVTDAAGEGAKALAISQ